MDRRKPTYLRIVVTTKCTLKCAFCHMEGDPAEAESAHCRSAAEIADMAGAAYREGVRKIKLLGGEPLARKDIAQVIALIRAQCPDADLSMITAGVIDVGRLRAAFAAGLDRANLSIHGWSPSALARNTRVPSAHAQRQAVLDELIAQGRFLKCNYVYPGPEVEADLGEFLAWAADKPIVVAVLDDLGNPAMGPQTIADALVRLRGPWATERREEDPHSFSTRHLHWADGLQVEVKDQQLGHVGPWRACADCPKRAQCREGIFALRLKHNGEAAPCMDRPDLGVCLRGANPQAMQTMWRSVMAG